MIIKGLIIYNGSGNIAKITKLVQRLQQVGSEQGIDLTLLKNNELVAGVGDQGEFIYYAPIDFEAIRFVIFWDKDILLAKYLEKKGLRLFNTARAIELCDDKAKMHLEFIGKKVPTPKTIFAPLAFYRHALPQSYYDKVGEMLGYPFVLKEVVGSFGMQVYEIKDKAGFEAKVEELGKSAFLMQEFIQSSVGRDIRVNIIGDRVVGAILRQNAEDFRANITLGGTAQPITLTKEQEALALKAHQALGLDFSGVDLLFEEDGMTVCEVNSNVNFLSFEEATGINFAQQLIDYVKREMKCVD